jgi:Family of unknown function (DUF6504)
MSMAYGEPVNVQARDDGRPARFVWRGRLYTVRVILEHWVINREWWQDPLAEPGQPELEFWRVEASPGQGMAETVFELRRDAATDTWTLRVGALRQALQVLDVPQRRIPHDLPRPRLQHRVPPAPVNPVKRKRLHRRDHPPDGGSGQRQPVRRREHERHPVLARRR